MTSIEKAMDRRRRAATPRAEAESPAEPAPATVRPAIGRAHPLEQLERPADIRLDHARLGSEGLLTPEAENRGLREQYRLVKRKLITQAFVRDNAGPNPANLVQVTSSVAGEGKTFTTFNLGMSVAMERDITVLLVDSDLSRCSLSHVVGLEGRDGLTELMTGQVGDVSDVLYRTDVPRLAIIPAGRGDAHASELIASEDMRTCTRELAGRYRDRLILFDSTPLLMDSQASSLAGHMGQVLIVVEAGRTGEGMLREAVALLGGSGAGRSLVLNKSARGHGYGYYGGY